MNAIAEDWQRSKHHYWPAALFLAYNKFLIFAGLAQLELKLSIKVQLWKSSV